MAIHSHAVQSAMARRSKHPVIGVGNRHSSVASVHRYVPLCVFLPRNVSKMFSLLYVLYGAALSTKVSSHFEVGTFTYDGTVGKGNYMACVPYSINLNSID